MPDKDQFGIYNKDELSLIKNTFANNDTLLYTIRKVFLQFPLNEAEKGLIRVGVTPEVYKVIKKRMLPDLSPEYPLGQIPSILTTLTQEIRVKSAEEMEDQFRAKRMEIEYLRQQFGVLENPDTVELIKLSEIGATMDYVHMTAYLFILGYIDPSLLMIKAIAGEKEETPEDQEARLKRDSSK